MHFVCFFPFVPCEQNFFGKGDWNNQCGQRTGRLRYFTGGTKEHDALAMLYRFCHIMYA